MKVYIVMEFPDGPIGGSYQFMRALRDFFIENDLHTNNPEDAEIFLFNSFQFIPRVVRLKKKFPNKIFIHRIDGPIRLYNHLNDRRDSIVYAVNKLIADGTVFQSNWSKEQNYKMGLERNNFETVIINAPNHKIFNRHGKLPFNRNRKIRIIATSWSSNLKKGFETYKWLDENLDFSRYDMTFVGNSPIEFKNIIYKKPMNSENLALELKQHDIFITASQKDPCSNSLIEALHCGLPAIGLNDGGHPEIIGKGGEVFNSRDEIPKILEKVVNNYERYQKNIKLPTIDEVGQRYYEFFKAVLMEKQRGKYQPKTFSMFDGLSIKKTFLLWKFSERVRAIRERFRK